MISVQQIEEQYQETTWTTTDGTEIQAQNLEVMREETIETNCDLDQSQTVSGQQTTTITTVNSSNPQNQIAISNQMAPTTQQLLVTTNQFGQQQCK